MTKAPIRPTAPEQQLLAALGVRLLAPAEWPRGQQLLAQKHYLGGLRPVGERLFYVATATDGAWLAVLVFCAASRRLRARDQWIGWSEEQRRRRLPLVVNNTRFLLLESIPNLGSRTLALVLARLSADWQAAYGHPVLVVETFVDPAQFCGTVYTASGWQELGQTDGSQRHARDFYVRHDCPKRLFARELEKNARRSLQAEHLRPALASVEARGLPRAPRSAPRSCARSWSTSRRCPITGRVSGATRSGRS